MTALIGEGNSLCTSLNLGSTSPFEGSLGSVLLQYVGFPSPFLLGFLSSEAVGFRELGAGSVCTLYFGFAEVNATSL